MPRTKNEAAKDYQRAIAGREAEIAEAKRRLIEQQREALGGKTVSEVRGEIIRRRRRGMSGQR